MLRILLNGNVVEYGVLGLGDLTEELELKKELHGYLYQIQGSITFVQSDYDFLRSLFNSGYCADVTVDVQYSGDFGNIWHSKVKAIIKLAGVKWDLIKKTAECPLVGNSYLDKINNNRQIVFQLGDHSGTVLSKNGVDVSSKVVFHSDIQLFSPFRGRYFQAEAVYTKSDPPFPASEGDDLVDLRPQPRVGMFIWDALNLLIAMMADNEVDFVSDYFSYDLGNVMETNPEAFTVLMTGGHLRSGSTYPKLHFEQFFNDLHKLCNVWFAMEYTSGGKPCIRIENEEYFRQANSDVYFDSVKSMVEAIDLGKVYSKVVVGCSVSSSTNFPVGSVPLVHHVQEEFPLSGTCNVSNELNLRLEKLIISTNAIAEALPPISGFSSGGLVKRKFTTDAATSGPNQQLTDGNGTFKESLIEQKMLIRNTVTGEWSYITGIPGDNDILIYDEIFTPSGSGPAKDYEIHKGSEDTQFKDEVFLIQLWRELYSGVALLGAFPSEIDPPSGLWYYNDIFANHRVIDRHMGGVAQSIVSSLSDGNDEFEAGLTVNDNFADMVYFLPVPDGQYLRIRFEDDVNSPYFDTNGNYDPLLGIYSAPQGGYYHAYASIRFINNTPGNHDFVQQVEIVRVAATGDVIESESTFTTIPNSSSHTFTLDRTFYLQEGEQIQVVVKKPFGLDGIYLNQYVPWSEFDTGGFGEAYGVIGNTNLTFFGVDELYNGGGLVPASDPDDVRLLNFESELSVSRSVFDSVLANPFKYYHTNLAPASENPYYKTGFIGKISRGILDGECTMTQFKKMDGV